VESDPWAIADHDFSFPNSPTPRDPRNSPPQSPRSSTFDFLALRGRYKDVRSSQKILMNRTANVRTSRQQVVMKRGWLLICRLHLQQSCRSIKYELQYSSNHTDHERAVRVIGNRQSIAGYHFTTPPGGAMSSRLWFSMALWQDIPLASTNMFRMAGD
jgi:hypothetical protein